MKYVPPFGSTDPDASYVDRDTPGAVRGSAVAAKFFSAVQAEILDLIIKAGFIPTDGINQLAMAVQSQKVNYAAAGGTANSLTVSLSPAPAALTAGMPITLKVAANNTGAVTINVNGLGAVSALRANGAAHAANDLIAGEIVTYVFDGAAWRAQRFVGSDVVSGSLIARRVFTVSATYNPTPGTKKIHVTVTGGGGSGGGVQATNSSQYANGGGGAGAATVVSDITSGFSSVPMTIGAGAVGASGTNGNSGGTTSFGAFASAGGGGGGSVGAAISTGAVAAGGSGASASGGNFLNIDGGPGGIAVGTSINNFSSGFGGQSYWGPGAGAKFTTSGSGIAGVNFGSGGGGAVNSVSAGNQSGGAGGAGIIIVEEYA